MNEQEQKKVIKGTIIVGIFTFIVGGIIQFFMLRGKLPITSMDSMTNTIHTVLGLSIGLAIMLAMLLTIINYIKIKEKKIPLFSKSVLANDQTRIFYLWSDYTTSRSMAEVHGYRRSILYKCFALHWLDSGNPELPHNKNLYYY